MADRGLQGRKVVVYGLNHSPWTQMILMALHDRGVPTTLSPLPLSMPKWATSGLVMPAARFEGGNISGAAEAVVAVGSIAIQEEIERRYGAGAGAGSDGETAREAMREAQADLDNIFFCFCQGRIRRPLAFVRGFSLMRDDSPVAGPMFRALLCVYFFCLIVLGSLAERAFGRPATNMARLARRLTDWESRLAADGRDFFSGDGTTPGYPDFGLLGQLQCMATGLTEDAVAVVREHVALRAWLKRMHSRLDGYAYNYTAAAGLALDAAAPPPPVEAASPQQQALFFLSLGLALVFWPVTAAFLGTSFLLRWLSPARSGALRGTSKRRRP